MDLKTPCQTPKLEEEIDGLQNGDLFSLPLSFPSWYHSDCLLFHLTGNPPNAGMGSGGDCESCRSVQEGGGSNQGAVVSAPRIYACRRGWGGASLSPTQLERVK